MSKILKALALAAALFIVSAAAGQAAEQVVVNGSTTVLPIAQAAAEAYMKKNPAVNISVSGGGSGNGIKAIIDGTAQLATSSRFVKPEEEALAAKRGVTFAEHRVAIDAIVPIVHSGNPVSDLTVEQLSLIYQGKIRNWKEVGGVDMRIVVISRDTSSGTYETWQEKILHKARVAPQAQLQASSGAIVQTVSKNKHAIGYIGIGYKVKSVKALKVNGVEASRKTALDGTFPISRPLLMYTNGAPKGAVADFLKFVKGPEGQKIVANLGFVPLQ